MDLQHPRGYSVTKKWATVDGNEAAARIAHALQAREVLEDAQLQPTQRLGMRALETVACHHVLVIAAGRPVVVACLAPTVFAPAVPPRRFDADLTDHAASFRREREHRLAVEQEALRIGERTALRLVRRRMLEADEVVERRDQLQLQHAAFQYNGQFGDAVLVCAMRMLCRRGDREREGQDDDAGEEDRTQAGWHGRGKWRQAIRGA